MKNVLVKVIHHEGGFFSNFNKVTTYLRNKDVFDTAFIFVPAAKDLNYL